MKAVVFDDFGGPDKLHVAEVKRPATTAETVLVQVTAVSVNHVDTFVRSGAFKTPLATPHIAGRDLVGRVVASSQSDFKVGDQVWTNSMGYEGRMGATAEYVAIPVDRLYHVPAGVDGLQLVAAVHSAATAAIVLHDVMQVQAGQRLLIEGAAGNVGRKLIQLATAAGVTVVTTSASRDFAQCQQLGSQACYDYQAGFEDQLVRDDWTFDHVIDTSGRVALATNLDLLRLGGEVTLITAPKDDQFTFGVRAFYMAQKRINGFVISHATVDQLARAAEVLNQAFSAGQLLDDQVSQQHFADASRCHQRLEDGQDGHQRFVLLPD
ncbi:medium-chain degydrogenase/reductase, Qor family [Lactiplantibacillus pentosus KCA1]|nr:zinc-binding dehydrogenase [Lactiplantibacillus pentosus]EIW13021.1 medium-chain degydrogenase/reductase, Qor family [Lactiplantibacillus pentosus KCA1]